MSTRMRKGLAGDADLTLEGDAANPYEPPSPVSKLDAQLGELDGHTMMSPNSSKRAQPLPPPANALSRADRAMTDAVRGLNQSNALFHWWSTLVTLSVDEIMVFPVPTIVGTLLYFFAADPSLRHGGQMLLRLKDDFGALSLIEQALKLTFRRARPYAPKSKPMYAMPGEMYSFPSGHTMRGWYTAFLLADEALSPLPYFGLSVLSIEGALFWGICVAVSRIALGKHYVFDVCAGAVSGVFIKTCTPLATCGVAARMCLASIFTIEALIVIASPTLQKKMPAWWGMVVIVFFFWATMPIAA